MKFVAFGDPHIFYTNEFSKVLPNGSTSALQEAEDSMDWVGSVVEEVKPDFVVCLGDVGHTQGYLDAQSLTVIERSMKKLYRRCQAAGIHMDALVGNHELFSEATGVTTIPFFPCTIRDKIEDAGNILFVPYTTDYVAVGEAVRNFKGDVAFGHIDLMGAMLWRSAFDENGFNPSDLTVPFINGHYHHPQDFGKVTCAGALTYRDFKDLWLPDAPRGCLVWNDGSIRRLENPHTSIFHTIFAEDHEDLVRLMGKIPPAVASRMYLRLSTEFTIDRGQVTAYVERFRKVKYDDTEVKTVQRVSGLSFTMDTSEVLTEYAKLRDAGPDMLQYGKSVIERVQKKAVTGMDVRLELVKMENFMSFGSAVLDLTKADGITLVEGSNADADDANSNGAGKSALFEAIPWCLFGETLRGAKHDDVINRETKAVAQVTVVFSKEGVKHAVTRSRGTSKSRNKLIYTAGGDPVNCRTTADTQKMIEEEIGASADVFMSTVVISGSGPSFVELDDTQKKVLIEKCLNTTVYADAHTELGRVLKRLKKDAGDLAVGLSGKAAERKGKEDSLVRFRGLRTDAEREIEESRVLREQERARLVEEMGRHKDASASAGTGIGDLRNNLDVVAGKLSHVTAQIKQAREDVRQADREYTTEEVVRGQVKKLLDSKTCPTCGTVIDVAVYGDRLATADLLCSDKKKHRDGLLAKQTGLEESAKAYQQGCESLRADIGKRESAVRESERLAARVQESITALDKQVDGADKLTNYDNMIREYETAIEELSVEIAGLEESAKVYRRDLESLRADIGKRESAVRESERPAARVQEYESVLEGLSVKIAELEESAKVYQQGLESFRADIGKRESAVRESERLAARVQESINALDKQGDGASDKLTNYDNMILEYELAIEGLIGEISMLELKKTEMDLEIEKAEFWVDAFSPTGLRSILLDKAVDYINERLAVYSEKPLKIIPVKEGKETVTSKISILLNNDPSAFRTASSGERTRVELAVQFALSDLRERFVGSINICVVDEFDGGLDDTGVSMLVDILKSRGKPSYLVTHHPTLKSLVSKSLLVVKENGVSRIQV